MELWQLGLLSLLGIGSGWLNVMAGGGSLLTVPMMVFLGLPGPVANGTNRISIIAQNIMAVWGFFSKGFSDFRLSASLAVAACFGAYFGANVGVQLEGPWFNRVLAVIMVVVLGIMLLDSRGSQKAEPSAEAPAKNLLWGHLLMIGAGFWGGFIQIAVGFLLMPILYRVMGLDLVRTNMHKVFIALCFNMVALSVFATSVQIIWQAGFALAIGNSIGGYLGARSTIAKGAPLIKAVMTLAIVSMIIKLLFF